MVDRPWFYCMAGGEYVCDRIDHDGWIFDSLDLFLYVTRRACRVKFVHDKLGRILQANQAAPAPVAEKVTTYKISRSLSMGRKTRFLFR